MITGKQCPHFKIIEKLLYDELGIVFEYKMLHGIQYCWFEYVDSYNSCDYKYGVVPYYVDDIVVDYGDDEYGSVSMDLYKNFNEEYNKDILKILNMPKEKFKLVGCKYIDI